MTLFDYTAVGLLVMFMCLNWVLPRSLGAMGVLLVHIGLVVCYFALAGASMSTGRYEYDGPLSTVGLVLQAFVLNCLLLPIALAALWRRSRVHRTPMALPLDD